MELGRFTRWLKDGREATKCDYPPHQRSEAMEGRRHRYSAEICRFSATGLWQIFQEALNESKRAVGSIRSAMSGEMFTWSSIAAS